MAKNKNEKSQKRRIEEIEVPEKSPKKARKLGLDKSTDDKNNGLVKNENTSKKRKMLNASRKNKMSNDEQNKKQLKTHPKEKLDKNSAIYKVILPPGRNCCKEALKQILNKCRSVFLSENLTVTFASNEEAKERCAELEKVFVGGSHLLVKKAVINTSTQDPLKRIIYLIPQFKETEKLKQFYGATDVEHVLSNKGNLSNKFVLTFATEAKAIEASKKSFDFKGKPIELNLFGGKVSSSGKRSQEVNSPIKKQKENKKQKVNVKQQKKNKKKPEKMEFNLNVEGDEEDSE